MKEYNIKDIENYTLSYVLELFDNTLYHKNPELLTKTINKKKKSDMLRNPSKYSFKEIKQMLMGWDKPKSTKKK